MQKFKKYSNGKIRSMLLNGLKISNKKPLCMFILFDIKDFLLSITENLLICALRFGTRNRNVSTKYGEIMFFTTKLILRLRKRVVWLSIFKMCHRHQLLSNLMWPWWLLIIDYFFEKNSPYKIRLKSMWFT